MSSRHRKPSPGMMSRMDTYPTRRSTVYGEAAVASSSPLAASAALKIPAEGGTATDAAVAAAMTLTVVEPTNNGIGGDLLALVWDGERLHGLNASGRSPWAWTPEHFAQYTEMPKRGWDSVTLPGAVSGWRALSDCFGRLDFARLGRDAVRHAEEGWRVSPIVGRTGSEPPGSSGGSRSSPPPSCRTGVPRGGEGRVRRPRRHPARDPRHRRRVLLP